MIKSVRKSIITYFMGIKFPLNKININEMKVPRNRMPAAALISRSFKTGISYPSTSSPNLIIFFIFISLD
jgi:hypothetical protein